MKWFQHDCDASNDSRIRKLKAKFGMEGYGVYFGTLELIGRKMEKDIKHFGFLPDEWDDEALELEFGLSSDKIRTMFDYMCQIGLFEIKDHKIFNGKIVNRCDDYTSRVIRRDDYNEKTKHKVRTQSEQSMNSVRTKSDNVPLIIDNNTIHNNKIKDKKDPDTQQKEKPIDIYIKTFNEKFNKAYTVTEGRREKLKHRLKNFTLEQVLQAVDALSKSPWHRGKNDQNWQADPDFLIRSDEQIDKWLQETRQEQKGQGISVVDMLKKRQEDYAKSQ